MLSDSFSKIAEACPSEVSFHWHELDEALSVRTAGVLPAARKVLLPIVKGRVLHRRVTKRVA